MKVLLAGGGTAGHINPAIAIAKIIKKNDPNADILFIGNIGGMEEDLIKKEGYDFQGIVISGFSRKISLESIKKNLKTIKRIIISSIKAKEIIKKFQPDICIGTGGYVSGPVIREAIKLKIPSIILEQNAYPGVTTKILAKKVQAVMLGVEDAKNKISKKAITILTGNPVRSDVVTSSKEESRLILGLDNRPVILSFGGSLGARKINEAIIDLILRTSKKADFQHIHAYGKYGRWFVPALYDKGLDVKKNPQLDLREYIYNMPTCISAADLIICRAGAITISEIESAGKASILIPSPNVAENHQYHNAMALVNKNAARIIEEKDLTGDKLIETVYSMFENKETIHEYEENAKKLAINDTDTIIYNLIKDTIKK